MNFIANETAQKLRGGYYTPADLAGFIAKWISVSNPKRILEPSCGDGAFFSAIGSVPTLQDAEVTAFELNVAEAVKAKTRASQLGMKATVNTGDFLSWASDHLNDKACKFDAIVGNPPFVRYQYLPADFQILAEELFLRLKCKFTKHTNAWVPFVLSGIHYLRPGGRLAMVVPAELIHVMHAQSLRDYLVRECRRIVIIDPREIWFSDTLQGAVILMAEKATSAGQTRDGLGVVSVLDREFVGRDPEELFQHPDMLTGEEVAGKWTRTFLSPETREVFRRVSTMPQVHRFDQIAGVDVGIVTGANKFFLVDNQTVSENNLFRWAKPMFGRSEHCPGIIYDERQHAENAKKGSPTNFLWFGAKQAPVTDSALRYIASGEAAGLHKRYKCRIREPWYAVPSVYTAPVGMLKRAHHAPRLLLNRAEAFTTDTAYRISPRGVSGAALVAAFLNPLTALSAELEGRHYGGGVLELVPSEIERLLVPLPTTPAIDVDELDLLVRSKPLEEVIRSAGSATLAAAGVSPEDVQCLHEGWLSLKSRRQRLGDEGGDLEE